MELPTKLRKHFSSIHQKRKMTAKIRRHRRFLIVRMDPDHGLLDGFQASEPGIIRIRHTQDPIEKIEKFLDYILKKDSYTEFIDALNNSKQKHIANFIMGNGERKDEFKDEWPLTDREIRKLDANNKFLTDVIDTECGLIGSLFSNEVLNVRQKGTLNSITAPHQKVEVLLEMLRRCSLNEYRLVIQSLHESNQSHVAGMLEEERANNSRYRSPLRSAETVADKEERKGIRGLTLLENELFVVRDISSTLEVHDPKTMTLKRTRTLEGLEQPGVIVSCKRNRCLYVIDKKMSRETEEIFKVSREGIIVKKQKSNQYGRLSVTDKGEVILAAYNREFKDKLVIYSAELVVLKTVEIRPETKITCLWQAIELEHGKFLVSHGVYFTYLHRVCIINPDGEIAEHGTFGRDKGDGNDQLKDPICLVVKRDGSILVADSKNKRIIELSSNLEFRRELGSLTGFPEAMCLDEDNGKLFVGYNEKKTKGICGAIAVMELK